jgi:16S rRNA (guanine(1405)-N(7))-methyltransferase
MTDATVTAIVAGLRESKKYRNLSTTVLDRTARWATERYPEREALKAAKRKLHQIYAAFCPPGAIARLRRLVRALPQPESPDFGDACRTILSGHASTAERLPLMDSLYPRLWEMTGPPKSVLDLACGFQPFALPWMGLSAGVEYVPWDLDEPLIEQINSFLTLVGRPPAARCRDALTDHFGRVDVVLLLKSLPCLEQQESGVSLRLIRSLPARTVVVSFPTAALGGRRKGMRLSYGKFVESLATALGASVYTDEFPGELLAVFRLA